MDLRYFSISEAYIFVEKPALTLSFDTKFLKANAFCENISEKVKKHSSRGTISVTFTATATTLDGRVLNSLMPSSAAYIH